MITRLTKYLFIFFLSHVYSQDDLSSFLDPYVDYGNMMSTFKSTRIVNSHSTEIFEVKQLDMRISHRFGQIKGGIYDLFGLDQAKIRVGLEYGLYNNLMIGLGRSTNDKSYDSYLKYKFLSQSSDFAKNPVTMVLFSNIAVNTLKSNFANYPTSARLSYTNQILVSSKLNDVISVQFSPTWVHWNMVQNENQNNDIFLIGSMLSLSFTKSTSINFEYFNRINTNNFDDQNYQNSFSLGLDIETGGHVFQLHITNSMNLNEASFLTRSEGDWKKGNINFGFNISREFSL
jgi:hypothetical protein